MGFCSPVAGLLFFPLSPPCSRATFFALTARFCRKLSRLCLEHKESKRYKEQFYPHHPHLKPGVTTIRRCHAALAVWIPLAFTRSHGCCGALPTFAAYFQPQGHSHVAVPNRARSLRRTRKRELNFSRRRSSGCIGEPPPLARPCQYCEALPTLHRGDTYR